MQALKNVRNVLVVMLGVALLTATLWAAPLSGGKVPNVSGEELSLVRLKRVRISVPPLHPRLAQVGVKESELTERLTAALQDAEFEIVDDKTAPLLELRSDVLTDPERPEVVVVNMFMGVQQTVRVTRIGKEMDAPTSTLYKGVITTPDKMAKESRQLVATVVRMLSRTVDKATKAQS